MAAHAAQALTNLCPGLSGQLMSSAFASTALHEEEEEEDYKLTLKEVAERKDASSPSVSQVLSGQHMPDSPHICAFPWVRPHVRPAQVC